MREASLPMPCPECNRDAARIMSSFNAFVFRDGYPRRIPDKGTYWHLGQEVKKRANKNLRFLGYVLNRVQARRKLTEKNIELFREVFGGDLLTTQLRESVRFQEATTQGLPITHYMGESDSADMPPGEYAASARRRADERPEAAPARASRPHHTVRLRDSRPATRSAPACR